VVCFVNTYLLDGDLSDLSDLSRRTKAWENFDRLLEPDISSKREQPNVVPFAMKCSRAFLMRILDFESFAGSMKSPRNSRILDPTKIS